MTQTNGSTNGTLRYKRVLLKLSGQALQGSGEFGIDAPTLDSTARQVAAVAWRALVAALVATVPAFAVVFLLERLPLDLAPPARSWIELVVAFSLLAPVSLLVMRRLGLQEMNPFVARLERLVDRRRPRRRRAR